MADDQKSNADCKCGGKRGKNLVVCIDGTSNKFGAMNTNVVEFYSLLIKDKNQRTFYNSGIGTLATPSWISVSYRFKALKNKLEQVFAMYSVKCITDQKFPDFLHPRHFEKIILEAYHWLSDQYENGDCIFLLGFSRGAYQVRTLAAMIDQVGLIHRGNQAQIPFAFEVYAALSSDTSTGLPKSPGSTASPRQIAYTDLPASAKQAQYFKRTFSRNVHVHFVGAWDTVSAVASGRRRKIFPYTISGLPGVCFFRHALALDERRVKYVPEYAYGATTLPLPDEGASRDGIEMPTSDKANIKEVWFTGSHSDIGGGSEANVDMASNGPSLRWMSYEAITAGIQMDIPKARWTSNPCEDIHDSLTPFWKLARWVLSAPKSHRRQQKLGDRFGRYDGRRIMKGQKIHASAFAYHDRPEATRYYPKAQVHSSFTEGIPELASSMWDKLHSIQNRFENRFDGETPDWVEKDILTWPSYILGTIAPDSLGPKSLRKDDCLELERLSKTDEGQFALLNNEKSPSIIFNFIKTPNIHDEDLGDKLDSLSALMNMLLNFAADRSELFCGYNDLYPIKQINLFARIGSIRSDLAADHNPAKSADHATILARFFHRFSSGVGLKYHIQFMESNFVLSAGEIQGIYRGAEFNVYSDQECTEGNRVMTLVVKSTRALTSVVTMTPFPPVLPEGYWTSCLPISPGINWALRIAFSPKSDDEFRLTVLKSLEGLRKKSLKRLPVVIVAANEEPDFILNEAGWYGYSFEATYRERDSRLKSIEPQYLEPEYLADIVYGGAVYYWYFHLLKPNDGKDIKLRWFKDTQVSNGCMDYLPGGEIGPLNPQMKYGCEITNNYGRDLFIHVLIFNPYDHSIALLSDRKYMNEHPVHPNSSIIFQDLEEEGGTSTHVRENLKWRGDATSFWTPVDKENNICYLAILLSKSYTDYTVSQLPSPFSEISEFQKIWEKKPNARPWKTLFIPIILEQGETEQ